MKKTFWVYILASKPYGVLYIGITSDLIRRIHEHKEGSAEGFSKQYWVKHLVHFEQYEDAENAIMREKRLKKWRRSQKVDLIEKQNPLWEDLYPSLINADKLPAYAEMTVGA